MPAGNCRQALAEGGLQARRSLKGIDVKHGQGQQGQQSGKHGQHPGGLQPCGQTGAGQACDNTHCCVQNGDTEQIGCSQRQPAPAPGFAPGLLTTRDDRQDNGYHGQDARRKSQQHAKQQAQANHCERIGIHQITCQPRVVARQRTGQTRTGFRTCFDGPH